MKKLWIIPLVMMTFGLQADRISVTSVYWNTIKPAVVAHRGAADQEARTNGFHEGTIAAYRYAASIGADVLEMDVHKTTDNRLAVHHDDRLPGLCNGQDKIHNLSLTQLKACKGSLGYEIPELREILRTFPRYRMTIEMKTPDNSLFKSYSGIEALLWSELVAANMTGYVSVSSINGSCVKNFRNIVKGLPTGLSAGEQISFLLCHMARLPQWACAGVPRGERFMLETPYFHKDLTLLGVNFTVISLVTTSFTNRAHNYDYRVNYWTVNAAADIQRVYSVGADGVISDNPRLSMSLR